MPNGGFQSVRVPVEVYQGNNGTWSDQVSLIVSIRVYTKAVKSEMGSFNIHSFCCVDGETVPDRPTWELSDLISMFNAGHLRRPGRPLPASADVGFEPSLWLVVANNYRAIARMHFRDWKSAERTFANV